MSGEYSILSEILQLKLWTKIMVFALSLNTFCNAFRND